MRKMFLFFLSLSAVLMLWSCSEQSNPNNPAGERVKEWSYLGTPGFSIGHAKYPNVEVHNGIVYTAYSDQGNSFKLYVKKFISPEWVDMAANPVDDTTAVSEVDLAVNSATGQLLVSAYSTAYSSFYVHSYNGSQWSWLGGGPLTAYESYGHVEADGNTVYAVFGMNNVIAQKFIMPSGPWENFGGASVTPAAADGGNLCVYNGEIYAAFPEDTQKTTVLKFNGSAWEPVGSTQFSVGASMRHTIKVDSTGVYVLYMDLAIEQKTTLMKYDGVSWAALGGPGFSENSVYGPALALEDGVPYVSYINQSDFALVVQKYTGAQWETIIPDSLGCSGASYTDISVEDGDVYVAFDDINNGHRISVAAYR